MALLKCEVFMTIYILAFAYCDFILYVFYIENNGMQPKWSGQIAIKIGIFCDAFIH